jgi:hypothetical protein
MGGFAAAIGGAGQQAAQYGAQVRNILEQRRGAFAQMLTQQAAQEADLQRRSELLGHVSDLYAGKDMSKVGPAVIKTLQDHRASDAALGQALGAGGPTPTLTPAPAGPGQTPGTAAQPSTSPVSPQAQGPQGPQAVSQPATIGTGGVIPPVDTQSQSAPQPSGNVPAVGGAPSPFDARARREQIIAKYHILANQAAPIMRPQIAQEMQAELAHLEPLEQQQNRMEQYEMMSKDPSFQALPAHIKAAYLAEARGFQPVTPQGMTMMPRMLSTGTLGNQAPPGTMEYNPTDPAHPKPVDPNTRYRVMQVPMTGEVIWQPEAPETIQTQTPGGMQLNNRLTGGVLAPLQGAIPPSENTPFRQPTAGGGVEQTTPANVISNTPPVPIAGAVSPSLLPHTSVSSTPGQLPTTTTRTVGGVHASAGGGSTRPGGPLTGVGGGGDPITAEKYKEWSAGGPAPTGKALDAVQGYAASHGLPTPIPMSATGQKDLAQVDDVLTQIKSLKQMMEQRGMDKDDSKTYYPDYFKYMHGGMSTPNQDLWTGLSFEGLRSAAAALRGSNARSYPIFSRALEHVPNPTASMTHLPDSPKNMYGKLGEMEKVLTQGRTQIINDEKKSGVTAPTSNVSPVGAPSPGTIEDGYRFKGGDPSQQSNWERVH